MMSTFYQVGEVCQLTGLTPRALHYYDEIGLLVPSERLAGGHRLYTAADLERIERIKELKRLLGLSLNEIKHILDAEDARARHLAAAEETADPSFRRRALESALRVTTELLASVEEKVMQLGRLQRRLEREARDLRFMLRGGEHTAAPSSEPAPGGIETVPHRAVDASPAEPHGARAPSRGAQTAAVQGASKGARLADRPASRHSRDRMGEGA
jgi:MerR family transcriptional regulator, repressor of the yfmOP operon